MPSELGLGASSRVPQNPCSRCSPVTRSPSLLEHACLVSPASLTHAVPSTWNTLPSHPLILQLPTSYLSLPIPSSKKPSYFELSEHPPGASEFTSLTTCELGRHGYILLL